MQDKQNGFRFTLAAQLSLLSLLGATVIFGTAVAASYFNTKSLLLKNINSEVTLHAKTIANRVAASSHSAEISAQSSEKLILGTTALTEDQLDEAIKALTLANPSVYGMTVAYEPHAFATDIEAFSPYWFKPDTNTIKKLMLNEEYDYFKKDWYALPRAEEKALWIEPYFDDGGGKVLMTTYSIPVYRDDKLLAIATADIELTHIKSIIDDVKFLETGYAFLASGNGTIVVDPNTEYAMKQDETTGGVTTNNFKKIAEQIGDENLMQACTCMLNQQKGSTSFYNQELETQCRMFFSPVENMNWSIGLIFPEKELYSELNRYYSLLGLTAITGFIALIILARMLGNYFGRPLTEIVRIAELARAGNLTDAAANASRFTRHANWTQSREYAQLGSSFASMILEMNQLLQRVQHNSQQVNASAKKIAAESLKLHEAGSNQLASTHEVGATSTEIAASARDLAQSVEGLNVKMADAAALADCGKTNLKRITSGMSGILQSAKALCDQLELIQERSDSIGKVVETITKVANETNLLSLNAAIEAEKAGKHGRGFSVVARQIRKLADQTSVATLEIEEMITTTREAVHTGVKGVQEFAEQTAQGSEDIAILSGDLGVIIQNVSQMGPAFETVNHSMQAQAEGAEQISQAMLSVTESAEMTTTALEEFRATADALHSIAIDLDESLSLLGSGEENA